MDPNEDFSLHEHKREVINWDAETRQKLAGQKPTASYNPLSNRIRQAIPEEQLCSMFCGGKRCKYCDPPSHFDEAAMAIRGLYSAWVTDNILAMSRPSSRLIKTHNIVSQFREKGIRSVINVQRPGEHASCGDGLAQPNGFSYNPQSFMDNDIFFYNFGWKDYGVTSMRTILDMVRVMQFALSEGRVAVHCHAGLGRTGVILACYLVFNNRMCGAEAVHYVRAKRPGALQTQEQVDCVLQFSEFMGPLRCVFASKDAVAFNLNECLRRQSCLLHGYEGRRLKNLPKLLYVCLERLLDIALQRSGLGSPARHHILATPDLETRRRSIRADAALAFDSDNYITSDRADEAGEGGSKLDSSLALPAGGELRRSTSDNGLAMRAMGGADLCATAERPSSCCCISSTCLFRTFCKCQNSIRTVASDCGFGPCTSASASRPKEPLGAGEEVPASVVEVVRSFLGERSEPKEEEAVAMWKTRLNNEEGGFGLLIREEERPRVLAQLVMDWLKHLKTPIIQPQDIQLMARHGGDPVESLKLFERPVAHLLRYFALFLVKLQPLPEHLDEALVLRLLSGLAQQTITLDLAPDRSLAPTSSGPRMRSASALALLRFFCGLVDALENDACADTLSLTSQSTTRK